MGFMKWRFTGNAQKDDDLVEQNMNAAYNVKSESNTLRPSTELRRTFPLFTRKQKNMMRKEENLRKSMALGSSKAVFESFLSEPGSIGTFESLHGCLKDQLQTALWIWCSAHCKQINIQAANDGSQKESKLNLIDEEIAQKAIVIGMDVFMQWFNDQILADPAKKNLFLSRWNMKRACTQKLEDGTEHAMEIWRWMTEQMNN